MNYTKTFTIDLPNDVLTALNEDELEVKKHIKIALAITLYQQQKLTIGKAAQLCSTSKVDFESMLAGYHIPISNLSLDEVLEDALKIS